jgi:hypothetical protein
MNKQKVTYVDEDDFRTLAIKRGWEITDMNKVVSLIEQELGCKIVLISHEKYIKMNKDTSVLVCPLYFPHDRIVDDNLVGECSRCKKPIVFRKYNEDIKIKLCNDCNRKRMGGEIKT